MADATVPVIDGHNDTLTKIRGALPGQKRTFLARSALGHLDLPRARDGGLVGGFFAIFTASKKYELKKEPLLDEDGETVPDGWRCPLPPKLDRRTALGFTLSVVSDLLRVVEESDGEVTLVRTAAELRRARSDGRFAVILHIEGAEAIDSKLEALDVLHAAGLRSLGPVWSRPNIFGHGVPFDFPGSPDTGPGLTAVGKRLVARCNDLGVLVDLSHLNEQGFWDVADLTSAPLVATHSNAYALCPSPRNLTDAQLDEIARTGGIVGLNFHVGFLRPDGRDDRPTSLHEIVEHARYIADRIGVEHVGLGSDFDGAKMPDDLADASRLPALLESLRAHGFGEEDVHAIAYRNWERVVERTWGR